MPSSCCVVGCTTRAQPKGSNNDKRCSLFRIPTKVRQRRAWVTAIARRDWKPKTWERVCSLHFVSGWPSDDPKDVDYIPTVLMKGQPRDEAKSKSSGLTLRQQRAAKRSERSHMQNVAEVFSCAAEEMKLHEKTAQAASLSFHSYVSNLSINEQDFVTNAPGQEVENKGVQTDMTISEISDMCISCEQLQQQLSKTSWGVHKIQENDDMTKFYTGLPTFDIYMWLFKFLEHKAERMEFWGLELKRKRTRRITLPLIDQLLFVLMRLKVGLFLQDLADRFNISISTLSRIFNTWIVLLEKELSMLNPFPTRDVTARTLPGSFANYPNIRCIIDCTELFIERASSLTAQSLTFSSYKHHNTIKFLVAIVPTGGICFVSEAWGGRVSDRHITEKSGFLDHILPGDLVMADKGFTIGDLLAKRQAYLTIPPFLSKKAQFQPDDISLTEDIARVRIHVERAIGRVKQFHILDPVIPLSLSPTISSIFRVCCMLSNLSPPLVHFA